MAEATPADRHKGRPGWRSNVWPSHCFTDSAYRRLLMPQSEPKLPLPDPEPELPRPHGPDPDEPDPDMIDPGIDPGMDPLPA